MDRGVMKQFKLCGVCTKPFTMRKKWEKCWDEVKYCSDKCKKGKGGAKSDGNSNVVEESSPTKKKNR